MSNFGDPTQNIHELLFGGEPQQDIFNFQARGTALDLQKDFIGEFDTGSNPNVSQNLPPGAVDSPRLKKEESASTGGSTKRVRDQKTFNSEVRRRENIARGFTNLKNSVPDLKSNASRSTILHKAADYINTMRSHREFMLRELAERGLDPKQFPPEPIDENAEGSAVQGESHSTASSGAGSKVPDEPSAAGAAAAGATGNQADKIKDERELESVINALENRLHIRAVGEGEKLKCMYRIKGQAIDMSNPDDVRSAIDSQTGHFAKLKVYVKIPQSINQEVEEQREKGGINPGINPEDMSPEQLAELDRETRRRMSIDDVAGGSDHNDLQVTDEIYEETKHLPGTSLGGERYKNVLWQKTRIEQYVKACKGKKKTSKTLLLKHYEWLEQVQPHRLTAEMVSKELQTNKMYWFGRDLQGDPVLYFQIKKHVVADRVKADSINMFLYMIQQHVEYLQDHPFRQFLFVYDRRGATMANSDLHMMRRLVISVQQHYPGLLKRVFIVHPDFVFKYSWSVVKKVASSDFRQRIKLLDDSKWKEQIGRFFTPDNLQVEYGGTNLYLPRYDLELPDFSQLN
eukprot:Clim_evm14s143 gene=Clim_evmTU14s143